VGQAGAGGLAGGEAQGPRVGLAHEAAAVGQRGEEGAEPEGDLAGQGGIGTVRLLMLFSIKKMDYL